MKGERFERRVHRVAAEAEARVLAAHRDADDGRCHCVRPLPLRLYLGSWLCQCGAPIEPDGAAG